MLTRSQRKRVSSSLHQLSRHDHTYTFSNAFASLLPHSVNQSLEARFRVGSRQYHRALFSESSVEAFVKNNSPMINRMQRFMYSSDNKPGDSDKTPPGENQKPVEEEAKEEQTEQGKEQPSPSTSREGLPKGFAKFYRDDVPEHKDLTPEEYAKIMEELPKEDPKSASGRKKKKGKKDKEEKQVEDEDKTTSNKDEEDGDEEEKGSQKRNLATVALVFGMVALVLAVVIANSVPGEEVSWEVFLNDFLKNKRVDKIMIYNGKKAAVFTVDGQDHEYKIMVGSERAFMNKLRDIQLELGLNESQHVPIFFRRPLIENESTPAMLLVSLLFVGTLGFLARGVGKNLKGVMSGNMNKGFKPETNIQTRFNDVAGLDEAKTEIHEFVQFLKKPDKFVSLGARIPKGAMLVGPPGTGKTLLAKAVAGEAGVPFYSVSGSDFVEMFVGVGPARVRELFAKARKTAPCIVFIDEIDAVGKQRNRSGFVGGNDERDNTLNQLLVEMDGFSPSTNVVVLAGTNRVDVLDKALLRPGRFDRQIALENPDIKGREAIFRVHLKPIKLAMPIDSYSGRLAALTPGFSGADIANVCNEAALVAARERADAVAMEHFEKAIDRVIGGLEKKNKVLAPHEKKIVAYHEAGHAVVGWFLKYAHPLLKVSIVPRGSAALGYAQYLPEERYIHIKEEIIDSMCVALGGRASERVFFNHLSTGAQDDLRRVTQMAYSQIITYGMSPTVGHMSFPEPRESEFAVQKPYSEETAHIIDLEVKEMVDQAYARTEALVRQHKDHIEQVAQLLLEREKIDAEDLVHILGKRPWGMAEDLLSYLDSTKAAKEEQVTEKEASKPESQQQEGN